MITLRPDQKIVIKELLQKIKEGHRQILVVAPCGFGKAYLIAWLEQHKKEQSLITCHRKELKEQHQALMPASHIELPITAYNMLQRQELGEEKILQVDEAHLALADTWNSLIQHYKQNNAFIFLYSATPERLDGKPFTDVATTLVQGPSVKWLIDNKFLSPFKYFCPQIPGIDNITDAARSSPEAHLEEFNELFQKKGVLGHVVQSYEKFLNNKKVIVYCVNKNHAKEITESFQAAGHAAESIDSDDPKTERSEIMEKFRNGNIKILCNVGILSEGISINDLDGVLLCRPTSSYALFVQQSMRPLRIDPFNNKKTAIIIDFVNNYRRHGLPDEEHEFTLQGTVKKTRTKDINEEGNFQIRYCKSCFQAFKCAPKCPHCGTLYELEPREIEAHKDIEIAEIKEFQKEQKRLNKQSFDIELRKCKNETEAMELAITFGYNPYYGAIRFRHGHGRFMR